MRTLPALAFTLALTSSPFWLRAEEELKKDTRLLTSFEASSDKIKTGETSGATVVSEGATDGTRALRMKFLPSNAYPSVQFHQEPASDFRGYGGIAFDLYNPGEESVAFAVRVDSSPEADGNGNHSRSGKGSIDGKQKVTFVMPFGVDPAALKMRALPGYGDFRSLGSSGSGPFELGNIVMWQIFMARPQNESELIVDNVRLIPGRKQDFNKIIDTYGQYTREDWPGKVKSDMDLKKQLAEEDKDLAAHKALPDRDKYGGWAAGPKLDATGFFRVEKYKGKWAFVDPEGHLFLSFGPTTVTTSASTPVAGREYMFTALPANEPFLARFKTGENGEGLDFLSANLQRKYGDDYKKVWYERTYDRLASWGFNTIGAFSSWDTLQNNKIPYTSTIWPSGKHARVPTGKEHVRAMYDPFDPQFAADMDASIKGQVQKTKDDPYCIGYFVGNEEDWGHFRAGPRSYYTLPINALKLEAAASPAKRAFLDQLQKKYGDVAKLNSVWKTNFADWKAMEAPVTFKDLFNEAIYPDFSAFLASYAEEYFRVVAEAIKKADPNHLYLGCRFAGYSPEVLQAAAKYNDVMSFNIYRLTVSPKEFAALDSFDKPVVIGEFHFGATDRGVFDIGLIGVADQKARAKAYQNYIKSVLDHPKLIGAHWFQYTDQPTTGRGGDGENGNVGYVSITDTPYPELIEATREINSQIYPLRFGK